MPPGHRREVGRTAFGYEPPELIGVSILAILHPLDHQPFLQTAKALLAMAGSGPGSEHGAQTVRALHRVFCKRSGEQMVDSIITAARPNNSPTLIISSRCSLPFDKSEEQQGFRVFPVGPPHRGNQST